MKILFHFIHPSKFHLFKNLINKLIKNGHEVDVTIITKDVIEDLVIEEGWNYTNIFKEGRKIPGIPIYLSALINLFRTIFRLYRHTMGKKYDLFFTDDLLGIIGKIRRVKTYHFTDDHLNAIPEQFVMFLFADKIITPSCVNLGFFSNKQIKFDGIKQSAYLHPNYFNPNPQIIKKLKLQNDRFFLIRLVSLKATHDVGKKGITDDYLRLLIKLLSQYGSVKIVSERDIPLDLKKFEIKINSSEILNVIYYSDLFIGDSQTMCAEAGFLGVPFIWYSHFYKNVCYLELLIDKYKLGYQINLNNFKSVMSISEDIVRDPNYKNQNLEKRKKLIRDTIDLTDFMFEQINIM